MGAPGRSAFASRSRGSGRLAGARSRALHGPVRPENSLSRGSILDDFEWDAGYPPRCGLYNYDYETHEIADRDALGDPAGEIYAYLIRALRSGDKEIIAAAFTKRYGEGPSL